MANVKCYFLLVLGSINCRKMTTFKVESPNVHYTSEYIESKYTYETTKVDCNSKGTYTVKPVETVYTFRTERHVPKIGCMLVGWGGNNGSTITAAVLANKLGLSWNTKLGVKVSSVLVFCSVYSEGRTVVLLYSWLPITQTFKGNRKKFELSGAQCKKPEIRKKLVFTIQWTF